MNPSCFTTYNHLRNRAKTLHLTEFEHAIILLKFFNKF
jgi:hypothetical protein